MGRKFTMFALFYFVFEGKFQVQAPRGAYIWKDDLTEGFLSYDFGGLIFGGLIHGGAYFRNFYNSMWIHKGIGKTVLNLRLPVCSILKYSTATYNEHIHYLYSRKLDLWSYRIFSFLQKLRKVVKKLIFNSFLSGLYQARNKMGLYLKFVF